MLMHQKPAPGTLPPNTRIAYLCFYILNLFCVFRQMHGKRRPRHRAMATHLQILPRTQRSAFHVVKERRLHSFVVFLPTVIRKWSEVVKYEAVLLGVESRWIVCVSRAPGRTIAVDEVPKSSIIGSFLLRACPDESKQAARKSERNIQKPAPPFATSCGCGLNLQDDLRSPQDFLGTKGRQHRCSLVRIPYGESRKFARGISYPSKRCPPSCFPPMTAATGR